MNTINQKITEFSKKSKIIKGFNPFNSKNKFGCPTRLCCNVYVGCLHRCSYCYNWWMKDFENARQKKNFEKNIEKDVELIFRLGLENLIISISNSTDAFQEPIESKYKHSLLLLSLLSKRNLKVLILTKNPSKLLEKEYLETLKPDNTAIEVSIPFCEQRSDIEPFAPAPIERIIAVKELIKSGLHNVSVRIDPIIPNIANNKTGQSPNEIKELINSLSSIGVKHVCSKVLRLVGAINKANPFFYSELKNFYKANGSWEGNCYQLKPEIREDL